MTLLAYFNYTPFLLWRWRAYTRYRLRQILKVTLLDCCNNLVGSLHYGIHKWWWEYHCKWLLMAGRCDSFCSFRRFYFEIFRLFQCRYGRGLAEMQGSVALRLGTLMIVFFAYFYTFNVSFKPDDVAENLKNQNGFIPGIRPGKKTSEHLEYVLNRVLPWSIW